jgi:hypothetical protein
MLKKLIIFIVIIAAIWAMPSGRAKLGQWMAPVLVHLGPVGDKLSAPMKKYEAKSQIGNILSAMHTAHNEGKAMPDARMWSHWLREHPASDEHKDLDPWGTQYYLRFKDGKRTVGSAGPDRVLYNADDITEPVTF